MAATMVITIRVRLAEAALQMVSDGPGPRDTMTRGNSAVNTAALAATMPSALSPNAAAARPAQISSPDPVKASAHPPARTSGTGHQRSGRPAEPQRNPA